jgi:hypothetical protein
MKEASFGPTRKKGKEEEERKKRLELKKGR